MARQTIGENPLDSYIASPQPSKSSEKSITPKGKQRLTVQLSKEVVERAKNAVYWTRGLTLAQLIEHSLEAAISELEQISIVFSDKSGEPLKEKGQPFPEREKELAIGRPVK
jgi:hypothetical protein